MRRPVLTAVLWICQIAAAAQILPAGVAKLGGNPGMVQLFDAIGWGQWFRFVTGGIEVVSVVLLFVPAASAIGAALLACTMIGAIVVHLQVLHASPAKPLTLLVLVAIVAAIRAPRLLRRAS